MRLLRLFLKSLLRMLPDPDSTKTRKVAVVMPLAGTRFDRPSLSKTEPAHECMDRPWLGCDACFKATGDPFATVNSYRQTYSKTG
jgi:hypothetical protein